MRFWTTGEADLLQVRRQSDGEVLYGSEQPNLVRADLRGKKLAGANLTSVDASWADFRDADLRGANLDVANLTGANLRRACLCGATLTAKLTQAKFNDADLRGADLQGSGLTWLVFHQVEGADFRGAIYNSATRWPWGFDPSGEGCVLVESDLPNLPLPAQAMEPIERQLPLPASTVAVKEEDSLVVNLGSRS